MSLNITNPTMSPQRFLTFFFFFLLSSHALETTTKASPTSSHDTFDFVRPIDRNLLGLHKKQKLSHFRFYWQDILNGTNPTSVMVVQPTFVVNTTSAFGAIEIIDDPLTLRPQSSSKLVGRAQGFYTFSSQSALELFMAMNFVFVEGKYNGSTLTILGWNPVSHKVREMPVIGGSGLFRFATGYAQASTVEFISGEIATVEYNVYVFHY